MKLERKNFIDNLRWMCILLLIPYHAAMAYNCWGESNYIVLGTSRILSSLIVAISPWFMTLLFLLAGMSAKYSLKRRSYKQFMMERLSKLILPLVFCTLTLIPILTYIAYKTNCGYTGGFFQYYGVFLTNWTDLTGYDGGFSIGHLWFLLYLFVISSFACFFDRLIKKAHIKIKTTSIHTGGIVLLILLAMSAYPIKLGGKSILTYLLLYLIGYYILSNDEALNKLIRHTTFHCAVWIILTILNVWLFIWTKYDLAVLNSILNFLTGGFGIVAILGVGHRFFNSTNKTAKFLTSISFSIYIVHFPWVVLFAYWLSLFNNHTAFIFIVSTLCSMAAALITCIAIKHCPIRNVMLAFKSKDE